MYSTSVADRLEVYLQSRFSGLVQQLAVEQDGEWLVISGQTDTYYAKQMISHAALDVADQLRVFNRLEVRSLAEVN